MYALAFFIGSRLVSNEIYNHNSSEDYDGGKVLGIFFAVVTGIFGFS